MRQECCETNDVDGPNPGQRFAPELRKVETRTVGTSPFANAEADNLGVARDQGVSGALRPVPLFSHQAHNESTDSPLPPPTHSFGGYGDTDASESQHGAWDAALPPRTSRAAKSDTCGLCAPWGCEAKVTRVKYPSRF